MNLKLLSLVGGAVALAVLAGVGIGALVFTKVPVPGAVPGPDISGPCFTVNGVQECNYHLPLTQATTTPCDITSPTATSSLVRATFQTTVSTTTALTLRFATSTVPNATTTSLTSQGLTGMGSVVYIPAASASVYAPKTHFVAGIEGTGYGPTLTGTCNAKWMQL